MKNQSRAFSTLKFIRNVVCFSALLLLAGLQTAYAQIFAGPGMPDNAFGRRGVVSAHLLHPSYGNFVKDVIFQADGKIVALGYNTYQSQYQPRFLVVRYNTNGSLDETFGEMGASAINFAANPNGEQSLAYSGALQTDGKIVAAGSIGRDIAVARYNTDGTLDPSFGNAGIVRTAFDRFGYIRSQQVKKVFVLPDGKILLVGNMVSQNARGPQAGVVKTDILTIRYNADGSFDETYANQGVASTATSLAFYSVVSAKLDALGNLFVSAAGSDDPPPFPFTPHIYDRLIVKYLPNGSVDPAFGSNGMVHSAESTPYEIVKILDDGKLILNFGGRVLRLNSDGSPDAELIPQESTVDGKLFHIWESVVQDDGKIISHGSIYVGNMPSYDAYIRSFPDGQIDPAFGTNGLASESVSFNGNERRIYLQPDGNFICAGGSNTNLNTIFISRHHGDAIPAGQKAGR